MLDLLDLIGTTGAAVLGLPGIIGLAFGMGTRNWPLAAFMGAAVGLLAAFMFGGAHATHIAPIEYAISIGVGFLAASTGCLIRHKGASV